MWKIAFAACLGLLVTAGTAEAGAIIADGNVQLGVDDFGQLNVPGGTLSSSAPGFFGGTTDVGVRYSPYNNEATADGCLCEGWGVGIADGSGARVGGGAGVDSGYANNASGSAGLALSGTGFTSTATTASSVVSMGQLSITHAFGLAAETNDLYRVTVSITNNGGDIAQLLYRRVMDWDVDPTTFDEFTTIFGADAATAVAFSSDNGFAVSDVFVGAGSIAAVGDHTDVGPQDHGAVFDFDFGALAAGETFEFDIFYGGSATERGAIAALAAVSAEVYSLGQANNDPGGLGIPYIDPASGQSFPTNTFIFGFSGVGGDVVEVIPEPSTFALFGLGAFGLVGLARRRRRKIAITKAE